MMEDLWLLSGRLHPLIVHLPIGILFLAMLFELISLSKRYSNIRTAITPALLAGFCFCIAAVFSGLVLEQEGGHDEITLNRHRYAGLVTALFTLILFFVYSRRVLVENRKLTVSLFLVMGLSLSVTGHFGGALTHGDDYLSFGGDAVDNNPGKFVFASADVAVDSLALYPDVIKPILESRCYSCHSAKKQKGALRLDEMRFMLAGGRSGPAVVPHSADSSVLFERILLPMDEKKHMPPKDKAQLSPPEVSLLKLWIEAGADPTRQIGTYSSSALIHKSIGELKEAAPGTWLPEEQVQPPDPGVLSALAGLGVLVIPVAQGTNYVRINLVNTPPGPGYLDQLRRILPNVLWLNASNRQTSEEEIAVFSKMANLRVLNLADSKVTDEALAALKGHYQLMELNLSRNPLTRSSIPVIKSFVALKKVFLFGTAVITEGGDSTSFPHEVLVDTGNYVLPVLASDTMVFRKR